MPYRSLLTAVAIVALAAPCGLAAQTVVTPPPAPAARPASPPPPPTAPMPAASTQSAQPPLSPAAGQPFVAQDRRPESPKPAKAIPAAEKSVTRGEGTFNGQRIRYTATASDTFLRDADGTPKARIFSTAYIKEPRDPARPVTFLYNGGPGSGSLWLHMGAFGPKRVVLPDAKDDGAPPFPIVDNPQSLLDTTDLVFIDPVGTGFSTVVGDGDTKDYWGVTQDAKSIAEFIRVWIGDNGRWNSPKFIGGESYGTTRSIAVAHELEDASYTDISLNGIILVSTILDFALDAQVPGNEMQFVATLPSYATTAWYHKKIANPPATVDQIAAEARAFASGPYLQALLKGNRLTAAERTAILPQLSHYTGLSEAFLDRSNLRVPQSRFYKELMRDQGLVVGRLDARYTGRDYDNAGSEPDQDPAFYGIDGAYTTAMNQYVRDTLKFSPYRKYVTIGGVRDWDWRLAGGRDGVAYVNVGQYVGPMLRQNAGLRIFNAQGWYDHATPFYGAEIALTRSDVPADRVTFKYYDAGHMMYSKPSELGKLSADIRAFIQAR